MPRGNFRSIGDGLTAKQRFNQKNREKIAQETRDWAKRHPDRRLDCQLRKYGIDAIDFNELLEQQGGVCKICGKPEEGGKKRLSVDHCHETGKIRGLLCNSCNVALGWFKHDSELLKAAILYLEQ